MTDPLTPSHPEALVEAAKLLNIVILNCWPRIIEEKAHYELMRVVAICWINVSDERLGQTTELIDELRKAAALLQSTQGDIITDTALRVDVILEKEPRLRDLFCY